MYKVCFADDEIMNHQLLEKLVDWEKYGFEIAGRATDGVEALQLYEKCKPDLFFIDIKMPCMDGLECAKLIRETDNKIKIVIISAYSEFTYAQKAIQYGVQDFIVKPVSRIVLNNLVEKIKQMLDDEEKGNDNITSVFVKMRQILSDGKFKEILQEEKYRNFFENADQMSYLRIFEREGSLLNQSSTRNIVSQLEKAINGKGQKNKVISVGNGKILLITNNGLTVSKCLDAWKDKDDFLIDRLMFTQGYDPQKISRFLEQSYFGENPGFYQMTGSVFEGNLNDYYKNEDIIDSSKVLEYLNLDNGTEYLSNYFETLIFNCKKEKINPAILKNSILDSLVILKLRLKDYFGEEAFYMLRDIKVNELNSIEKALFLKKYVDEIIRKLEAWIKKIYKEESKEMQIVKKANQYTRDNFMRIDFAVQEVADFVGLSRNYFVTVYKEWANRGFWDYVTELRIEKAKQILISKDCPISYVARYVGYESEYHFSRKFKKIAGVSPSKFRKSEQKANITE